MLNLNIFPTLPVKLKIKGNYFSIYLKERNIQKECIMLNTALEIRNKRLLM